MNTDKLKLFQKLYDLYLYLHKTVMKFPKSQRFLLSNQLLKINLNMIRLTSIANKKINRLAEQQEIQTQLDLFLVHIRLAKDLNFLSNKKYEIVMKKILEIDIMLQAWIRANKNSKVS
jgi:hypothetical protein